MDDRVRPVFTWSSTAERTGGQSFPNIRARLIKKSTAACLEDASISLQSLSSGANISQRRLYRSIERFRAQIGRDFFLETPEMSLDDFGSATGITITAGTMLESVGGSTTRSPGSPVPLSLGHFLRLSLLALVAFVPAQEFSSSKAVSKLLGALAAVEKATDSVLLFAELR